MVQSVLGAFMDPTKRFPIPDAWLGEADLAFARSVQRWADELVIARRSARQEDPAGLVTEAWPVLVDELGLGRAMWPEDLGGLGGGGPQTAMTLAAAAEQVGRADLSLGLDVAVAQALAACSVLGPRASDAVREQAAAWLLPGGMPALAAWVGPSLARVGERQPRPAGLEGLAPQVSARRDGAGWILAGKGVGPWSAGSAAQVFGIVAGVSQDPSGPGLFLVPGDAPGLQRGPLQQRVGLDGRPNACLQLFEVRVPESACLGLGTGALQCAQTWLHLLIAAAVGGAMLFADTLIADWGENRVIKGRGQRLRDNPLCASLMGELAGLVGLTRLQVFASAGLVAGPGSSDPEAVWLSTRSTAVRVLSWAGRGLGRTMELMGSAGYAREWNLERCWRDVRCLRSLVGGSVGAQLALARRLYASEV